MNTTIANLLNRKRYTRSTYFMVAFGLLLATVTQIIIFTSVDAAFSKIIVRIDRLQVSSATTGTVCATPASTGTESQVIVSFPTGFTVSTTTTNWTVTTTNLGWPTGATAWPSIATASAVSGQNVTFPSGDLTVGTLYCFNWDKPASVTTASTPSNSAKGQVATQNSGNTDIDRSDFTTALISNDQLAVTATVPQSFSFSLSGNTDALGTLGTGTVSTSPAPVSGTISTNAKSGWTVWAKDSNIGLRSTSAAYTLGSTTPGTNSTLTAGTEGYNTGITSSHTAGAGTITVAAPFVGGVAGKGGGLNGTFQTLASSSGTASGDTVTFTNNVAINALTPAATDYTDTITIVAAGSF